MSAKRKPRAETVLDVARADLERAYSDLRLATDQRGMLLDIRPISSSAADCRERLESHVRFMHSSRFIGPDGELAFARNMQLLLNVWIAALKYESLGGKP